MLTLKAIRTRVDQERGFTLVETLVAMVTGVIVTGALFAILQFSVHQTSRISQVAQASQISRTSMTRIVDELHSACLSTGFAPVQETSTPSKLAFQNGYSEQAEVPGVYTSKGGSSGAATEGVRQDTIEWDEKAGYLTDQVQLGTGAEEATGKYPVGTAKPFRLAEKVSQAEVTSAKREAEKLPPEKLPIFRYFEYAGSSSLGVTEAAATLKKISPTLKAGETLESRGKGTAKRVSAVQVSFRASPYTKEVKLGSAAESTTAADETTLTTFAFSAPDSEATIVAGPCE